MIYQLEQYDMQESSLARKPERITIDFLTSMNRDKNQTIISHMACWGNQLYIVDRFLKFKSTWQNIQLKISGRHCVYLTDLEGNQRLIIGKLNEKSSDEG